MATFLQLVQDTERDSGTMSTVLSTTVGAVGRHARFVAWVSEAWSMIQAERTDWRWLKGDFSGPLLAGVRSYDAAAMGVAPRFGGWMFDTDDRRDISIYLDSEGQDREGYLTYEPWDVFRRSMQFGSNATKTGKPTHVSVGDGDRLWVYPTPEENGVLRGAYYKNPQILVDDGNVPEVNARFHPAIKWQALILMGIFDEAYGQIPGWQAQLNKIMGQMRQAQLPRITLAGPLA